MRGAKRAEARARRLRVKNKKGADSDGVIAVVRESWTRYPGVIFDVDGKLPELKEFASYYRDLNGEVWVAELDGVIAGCAAIAPEDRPGEWMLHKLNVLPAARRHGIATALVSEAEGAARAAGAARMALWSDTRFVESHAFYAALGYEKMSETRALNDLSRTVECEFRKSL